MSIKARTTLYILAAFVYFGALQPAHAASVSIDPPASPVAVAKTELQLVVTFDTSSITPPATTRLTFTIKNSGAVTATNVAIDNLLPTEFSYALGQPTELANLGELAPGASLTKTYMITIPSTVASNRYVDEAIVSASNADSVESTIAIDVRNGEVLGATDELLAATGTSTMLPTLFGLALIAIGAQKLLSQRNIK